MSLLQEGVEASLIPRSRQRLDSEDNQQIANKSGRTEDAGSRDRPTQSREPHKALIEMGLFKVQGVNPCIKS